MTKTWLGMTLITLPLLWFGCARIDPSSEQPPRQQAGTRLEPTPTPTSSPSASPNPTSSRLDAQIAEKDSLLQQIEEGDSALAQLQDREDELTQFVANLDERKDEELARIDQSYAEEKINAQSYRVDSEQRLAEMKTQIQAQTNQVQALTRRLQELKSMHMTTTEVPETEAGLTEASAQLQALQQLYQDSRQQAARVAATQELEPELNQSAARRSLNAFMNETLTSAQSEITAIQKQRDELGKAQSARFKKLELLNGS